MRKMFLNLSNIGKQNLEGGAGRKLDETAMRGTSPSLPEFYMLSSLADQNGLTAGLLDRLLGSLRKLMRMHRNGNLDLAVIQHLEQAILLA